MSLIRVQLRSVTRATYQLKFSFQFFMVSDGFAPTSEDYETSMLLTAPTNPPINYWATENRTLATGLKGHCTTTILHAQTILVKVRIELTSFESQSSILPLNYITVIALLGIEPKLPNSKSSVLPTTQQSIYVSRQNWTDLSRLTAECSAAKLQRLSEWQELNLQGFLHLFSKQTRLPVPPHPQYIKIMMTRACTFNFNLVWFTRS